MISTDAQRDLILYCLGVNKDTKYLLGNAFQLLSKFIGLKLNEVEKFIGLSSENLAGQSLLSIPTILD